MTEGKYHNIVHHYESCLAKHGDSHLGVDWPNAKDAQTRYRVMLEIVRRPLRREVTLLDFGCGCGHLYEYMQRNLVTGIKYTGLDLSSNFIELSRSKFKGIDFYCLDLLKDDGQLPVFDYVVMNGVFTEKRDLDFSEMQTYFEKLLVAAFAHTRLGMAFNVMSSHVDWTREDLFHLPLDTLAPFLTKRLTRNFIIRNDYGLYEYTTYVYRTAEHG